MRLHFLVGCVEFLLLFGEIAEIALQIGRACGIISTMTMLFSAATAVISSTENWEDKECFAEIVVSNYRTERNFAPLVELLHIKKITR